ncbi:aspartate kinase [Streptomyces sp. NPDC006460]|uniref:amino acid kinase family protein n=1 Tax=Streptomyces sp. NPDC006460 TaxID=3154304 RepID=UPI0033BCEDF3
MTGPAVLKFGGSSFPSPEAYDGVAAGLERRIARDGRPLVVVVSAGPGETEGLRERLHRIDPRPCDENAAGLITLADTVGARLLAAAVHRRGLGVGVLTGHRTGLVSDEVFLRARLARIDPLPLREAVARHQVVVVPGGQAVDGHGRPTWLGKNSSDLSAVAAAVATGADRCEIHSDVDGVYTGDPHLLPGARLVPTISYDAAALMSRYGAKVIHRRAVELARRHRIELVLRDNRPPYDTGTTVGPAGAPVASVVLDRRSTCLRYASEHSADLAFAALHAAHVEAVRLPDGPLVAVVGGYVDLDDFHLRHGLRPGVPAGVPVTVLRGAAGTTHLAADGDGALALARRLHDELDDSGGAPRRLRPAGAGAPRALRLTGV